jgi:hypothetical protein
MRGRRVSSPRREKLKGIKQKLSTALVIGASGAVSAYDFLTPIVSGVDVSSLAAKVLAWPLVLICVTALFQYLRRYGHSYSLDGELAPLS